MYQFRGNFQLLVLHFCCILATCVAYNCSDDYAILQGQTKCFTDQGISFVMPELTKQYSGVDMRKLWMEALIVQKSKELCIQPEAFEKAILCDVMISKGCIPAEKQHMIPDQKSLKLLIAAICAAKQKVNFDCAGTKLKAMFACDPKISSPSNALDQTPESKHDAMCQFFKAHRDCQISILAECGCHTVRVLDLFLREVVQPITCPIDPGSVVTCEPAKVGYMDSGSNQFVHHFASMFVCVSLIALELSV